MDNVQTKQITVTVTKEAHELAEGIAKFVKAAKQATADGFQAGQDLPPLMSSALADLIPALNGVDKIGAEAKQNPEFANAIYLGLSPIVAEFTK